ncbi:MAG TPA: glycosyltransferase family 4 protein [Candidatus Acidoferrum sp.]|nr:glycosyltransferase family 4 protein [Candidatus Acidoferrum sp.]
MNALQLGFIVGAKPATGSERYYWDLLRTLPACGVDVRGIVVGDVGAVETPLATVESVAPEGGPAIPRLRGLRRAVAERVGESDVVVSHQAQHALPVLDLIRKRPFVVHFHGPLVREGRAERVSRKNLFMRGLAERAVYPRAQRIVVLSEAFGRIVQEDYAIDPARIRVVPGAVDLARFDRSVTREQARAELGWPQDRPIVLAVRRLAATKGLEELIDAIDIVRQKIPDVLLMLSGNGPLAPALAERVRAKNLDRWVRFVGQLGDALALGYTAADMTVVPSVALEGFGLVVVESLACGTPALVTPVGGLPEVVRALDPALIFERATTTSIAVGLIDALGGATVLPDADACATYAQRFDWPTIAAQIGDVYREVA